MVRSWSDLNIGFGATGFDQPGRSRIAEIIYVRVYGLTRARMFCKLMKYSNVYINSVFWQWSRSKFDIFGRRSVVTSENTEIEIGWDKRNKKKKPFTKNDCDKWKIHNNNNSSNVCIYKIFIDTYALIKISTDNSC